MSSNAQNLNNNQEDSLFSYFFSKDGFLGRGDFLGIIVLCHLFLQFAMKQSLILNDIIYCLAFYILSVAISVLTTKEKNFSSVFICNTGALSF